MKILVTFQISGGKSKSNGGPKFRETQACSQVMHAWLESHQTPQLQASPSTLSQEAQFTFLTSKIRIQENLASSSSKSKYKKKLQEALYEISSSDEDEFANENPDYGHGLNYELHIYIYIYIYIYIWTPSFIKHPPILIIQEYLTKHPATSIIQKVYMTSSKTYSQLQAEFHQI